MTIKQPRVAGSKSRVRIAKTEEARCQIAIQALCRGDLETSVSGVTAAASRPGREHIALRFGRVLLYLEDWAAVEALTRAVDQAAELAEATFGYPEDAFTQAEARARQRFEQTGDVATLR